MNQRTLYPLLSLALITLLTPNLGHAADDDAPAPAVATDTIHTITTTR